MWACTREEVVGGLSIGQSAPAVEELSAFLFHHIKNQHNFLRVEEKNFLPSFPSFLPFFSLTSSFLPSLLLSDIFLPSFPPIPRTSTAF
ncbi:hypothetical protein E2320_012856 [Naja naja]|nr:hypothetical protein E2320_012856 [Naja naja]